jgi:hypothetical protein
MRLSIQAIRRKTVASPPRQFNLKIEDFPELPAEFEPVLGILNLFSQQVVQAFTKQLNREDNIISQKKIIRVKSDSFPLTFKHTLQPSTPESVLIAQVKFLTANTPANAITITWQISGQDSITITSMSGLVADKLYEVTLIIS